MCGIAGYIGTKTLDNASAILESMQHRGPDGSGIYRHSVNGRHCYLFHTRLAIVDLDPRADQPMHYKGKHFVFNGELYNYRELGKGYSLITESDTEVFMRLMDDSLAHLDRCEFMGAFALYDENTGALTLCRDRFGEKPLYYHQCRHGVYFASEIKTLRKMGCDIFPNEKKVKTFLKSGYKSIYKDKETFWHGAKEIPAAHYAKIDGGNAWYNFKPNPYWRPTIDKIDTVSTYPELVNLARTRIVKAVERRLRSDVPLAFCMSGGVDSNTIVAIAKRLFDYDVHGFTILPQDERYNEQPLVEYAVRELGIRHNFFYLDTNDFEQRLGELVVQHDAPVATISYYIHHQLMGFINNFGYKVVLSGTGADELFSGYYDHYLMHLATHGVGAKEYMAWDEHVKPNVRNAYLRNPSLFIQNPGFRDHIYEDGFTETHYTDDLLRNRMQNEMFCESVPMILHEDDLNAMSFGIENRSPFLDRELMEFCYTIPTPRLIRNGYNKAVLRDAMRGIVPDKILDNRKKMGFNCSIGELMGLSPYLDNETSKEMFRKLSVKMFREKFGK
ncbi:MAG: asparagine synthase (glutamine-hydrolyzing) [FCB group bacterium]|nr:asparagine synthase (glutamine-hydrolyzing) [FCB group bacterium]